MPCIGLVVGILIALPVLLIVIPAAIGFAATGQQLSWTVLVVGAVCLTVYLPILLVADGILTTYIELLWTLTFLRLDPAQEKAQRLSHLHPQMRRLLILLVGLGLFLGRSMSASCPAIPLLDNCFIVRAQAPGQGQAILYPPDASAFPKISDLMDVFDGSGRFVSGLKPEQVTIVEDGQPLQARGADRDGRPAAGDRGDQPRPLPGRAGEAQLPAAVPGNSRCAEHVGKGASRGHAGRYEPGQPIGARHRARQRQGLAGQPGRVPNRSSRRPRPTCNRCRSRSIRLRSSRRARG